MYQYVTLLWNESNDRESNAARLLEWDIRKRRPSWRVAHACKGLVAFHSGESDGSNRAYALVGDGGLVVGKLFQSKYDVGAAVTDPVFDTWTTNEVVTTGGRYLTDHYWGSYIAFIRDSDLGGRRYVLRGPCGQLPCFSVSHRGVRVYFSRMEDCIQLGLTDFSTDWSFVVKHLACRGGLLLSGTALNEVAQIMPGECEVLTAKGNSRAVYWDPVAIATNEVIENQAQAVSEIKRTTEYCVSAWASAHKTILLLLSGGLDSTIVLNCLANAATNPKVIGLNCATPKAEGDEREFARLAASEAGVELRESVLDPKAVRFEDLESIERSAVPAVYTSDLLHSRRQGTAAAAVGATAVFTGQYGDAVFLQGATEFRTADFVRLHGLKPALLRLAYEEACMRNLTIWSVLRSSVKHLWRLPPLTYYSRILEHSTLLADNARASVGTRSLLPTTIADFDAVPRGKLSQILKFRIPFGYGDPFGNTMRPQKIHVLGSQPLLELSFRIPTYVLTANGIGRALVRKAFSGCIPAKIAYRRTKGVCTNLLQETFAANHDYIREQLLDGLLVREGLVDRNALEHCLSDKEEISVSIAGELPVLFSTEAWLQRWAGNENTRAVA